MSVAFESGGLDRTPINWTRNTEKHTSVRDAELPSWRKLLQEKLANAKKNQPG